MEGEEGGVKKNVYINGLTVICFNWYFSFELVN